MSLLSSMLETFYGDRDDDAAVDAMQCHLAGDHEQARHVETQWREVLQRRDADECYASVVDHALRGARDGETAWSWLKSQFDAMESFFGRL